MEAEETTPWRISWFVFLT